MSKLIDRLKETSTGGRSIGFPVGKTAKVPPMLVVAEVGGLDAGAVERAASAGANAIVARIPAGQAEDLTGSRRDALAGAVAAAGERPFGVALDGSARLTADTVSRLEEGGVDFVLMAAADMPASLLDAAKLAAVVTVPADYTDTQLRSLGELAVDAVQVEVAPSQSGGVGLTVADVVQYQRLVLLVHKPALASATTQLSPDDVPQLHALGIPALLVPAAGDIAGFVAAVAKIKPKPKHRGRGSSFVPAIGRSMAAPGRSDGDGDDDDDDE